MAPDLRELSPRALDCLKVIYKLSERGERVTTSLMRERLAGLEKLSGFPGPRGGGVRGAPVGGVWGGGVVKRRRRPRAS